MNKLLKILTSMVAAVGIVACGGGSENAGTPPFGGGTPPGTTSSAAAIDVIASAVQVQSAGDQVTITAIVKDAGNVSLPKAPVTFATDTGTLTSAATATDAAGVATAVLSAGTNHSNRPLTVTVRSGNAVGTLVLPVTGTVLSYTGPTTVALAKSSPISVKAVDSKGAPIVGMAISFASSLNNGLSATSANTDVQGTATVDYTATNAGTDTLTISGGGASVTPAPTIQISAADFIFVDAGGAAITGPVSITVGPPSAPLFVRYLVNGTPQVGKTVSFTTTAGTVGSSTATTNAAGIASVTLTSTTASPATLQATVGTGASTVQASVPILFVATIPSKLTLQVSPTAIGPNVGTSTAQQARVVATVVDANANPVAGATVNFSRVVDPSGGNLSQPSANTDASGQASVQFIAGPSTTASNGVQLRGEVAGAPSAFGLANLSVNQSALFIALGTGNTITNIDEQTYRKDWVVYVTDSNGIAVPNVTLTIKVLPLLYGKGFLAFDSVAGSWGRAAGSIDCPNEDDGGGTAANAYNGVLDPGEDRNGDGRLQPGNVISVTAAGGTGGASVGTFTTDATGRATISLIYAESYVPWVKVRLSASAVVTGTESSTQSDFFVIGLASDFTSKTVPPAGAVSPFGTVPDCTNPN